jgi:primosomal replication protein N
MKKSEMDIQKLREQIRKGLELTFQKLITQKKAQNGILVLSENGQIKKISAADISN